MIWDGYQERNLGSKLPAGSFARYCDMTMLLKEAVRRLGRQLHLPTGEVRSEKTPGEDIEKKYDLLYV